MAEGEERIGHQSTQFRALDRAAAKNPAEFFLRKRGEPLQPRRKQRGAIFHFLFSIFALRLNTPWLKCRELRHRRLAIPRANVLADVAADDRVSHLRPQLLWDRPTQLDREVGNALARIQHVRRCKRLRGASIQTQPAIPAQISSRRFARRKRRWEFKRSDNHTKKQPRAKLLVDQAPVFRQPAASRPFGGTSLCERTRIHRRAA